MSSTTPSAGAKPRFGGDSFQIAERAFDERQPPAGFARRGSRPAATAAGSRSMASTRTPGAASSRADV